MVTDKKLYECHITMRRPDPVTRDLFETIARGLKWKTSAIDGDPVLGKEAFYFTNYSATYEKMLERMAELSDHLHELGTR